MNPRRLAIPLAFFSAFTLGSACPPERDCPTGQSLCAGACTDPMIDANNCGACGHACVYGETCQAGVCGCAVGIASCSGVCTDLQSSADNCGSCGHACADTDTCFAGHCGTSCPADAGVIDCSGSCVDPRSDPRNCGACAHACAAKETCELGVCEAPDLYAVCFSGALIGYHSKTGVALPPFTVSVTVGDGGAPIIPGGLGLLFTDAKILWVLDTLNALVDVLDVTNWPPSVLGSVSVGQSPNQLALCDGLVLVVNSVDGTLQGIDPATRLTVNEVSLGAGTNPYLSACDGAHRAYVTDYGTGDVKAVDLTSWTVTATISIPPQDYAPGAKPYPQGVAFVQPAGWDAGSVFVALGNAAIDGGIFAPQGSAMVLEFDAALQAVQAVIDPGSACTNGSYLTPSADALQLYESCTGTYGAATTGFIAPIATGSGSVGPLIQVPVANPLTSLALSGGLLAVDGSGNQVVVFNPSDAGVVQLLAPCPTLPDGGTVSPYDFVGGTREGSLNEWSTLAAVAVSLSLVGAPSVAPSAVPPKRLVSMAPSLTDIVVDLGAGGLLVGVSRFDDAPRFKGLPRVGGYVDPDVEGVVRLRPDLVVALDGVADRATLQALRAAGLKVKALRDDSLVELKSAIGELAEALGLPNEGTRLNASLEATVERVRREANGRPPVRVAIAVGYRPLVLAGRGSYLEALVEAAGGTNVVRSPLPWPMSSFEALLQDPPAVLIDGAPLEQDDSARRMLRLLGEAGTRIERLPDQDLFRAGPRAVSALPILAKALRGP